MIIEEINDEFKYMVTDEYCVALSVPQSEEG